MSENLPAWFSEEFQSDVHLAYQREGSKLRNTVRTKTNVKGEKTRFNTAGKVETGTKARGADVPVLTSERNTVTCDLVASYGGDYVGDLDELMTNVDEKMVIAKNFAYAHGRDTDDLIIKRAKESTEKVGDTTTGLTKSKIQEAIEYLNDNDVPDDGKRTAVVTPHAWEELLQIPEFADKDYIGDADAPWLQGSEAKRWRNILWMQHSSLTPASTVAECVIYHQTAIGHAIGSDLRSTWSWENTKSEWFLNTRILQGTCLIDTKGAVRIEVKHDTQL